MNGELLFLAHYRFTVLMQRMSSCSEIQSTQKQTVSCQCSTDTAMCVVRCSHNTFGDRCFATAGPHPWNSLPSELRQCHSLGEFKRLLKAVPGPQRFVTFLKLRVPFRNHFTYLLLLSLLLHPRP